ncbi:MAG: DUF6076 domain-containing protein [Clostridiaceae bacterium]|nr:DUF6076 domain-containing protein [Clostridiaceae bacterium]
MKIAFGIGIYYENKKNFKNVVFFADGTYRYYGNGGMLFEIISDEAIYLLTEKVQNMLRIYPGKSEGVSSESIMEAFKWLYGTVEDEERPVATELLRSSFSNAISNHLCEAETENYSTVGDFMMAVYEIYRQDVQDFCVFFDALAADFSGLADPLQKEIAAALKEYADKLYSYYTRKCSVRKTKDGKSVETYQITGLLQLLVFEYCRMLKEHTVIKICSNCGRYFIPGKRIDTIYCSAPSPQNPTKSCKEIGAQIKRNEERRTDPLKIEKNRNLTRYRMAVKRAEESEFQSPSEIRRRKARLEEELRKYENEEDISNGKSTD